MTVRLERLKRAEANLAVDLNRFLPAALLGGYGIFILSLFLRRTMSLYINPGYVPWTTLAGAVLVGLGSLALFRHPASDCSIEGCEDEEHHPESLRIWTYALLATPLLLGLIFPPRGLTAISAKSRGPQLAGVNTFRGASTVKRVSLSVDTRSFSLQDWVGALSADPNPNDYRGKAIRLSGVVVRNPADAPNGYIMVIRYQVTCCIADARPVGLLVRDTSNGAIKDGQWVTLTGTMGVANSGGQKVVAVQPRKLEVTKSGNPYMY